ncbi:SDR family oxidoreductase [Prosthecomicrobium sp. N25]|uniref:SDR family oxidoreductase n=1 Tax=Prosthecomicrobium sp. N25 TaxID=3129254 RepID=UPI0030784F78
MLDATEAACLDAFPAIRTHREAWVGRYLVTGATGGMGVVLCRQLASAGHDLVMVGRRPAVMEALIADLKSCGQGSHSALEVDMADRGSVARFAAALAGSDIALDGAVIMPPQPARTADPMPAPEAWDALFDGSFLGPLGVLKAAIGKMSPRPAAGVRAKVVIVSGISSVQVLSHYATANVLRTAWLAQAKTLAFALGPQGIHVNTVSFGGTLTPHYLSLLQGRADAAGVALDELLAQDTENVPLRKYGSAEEAARTIAMLLSEVSDHMTGLNLLQDGGFTRAY